MPKALLLWLALGLATCAVPAHPPRRTLWDLPARFATLPLDLGNGNEVTVHGEGTIWSCTWSVRIILQPAQEVVYHRFPA